MSGGSSSAHIGHPYPSSSSLRGASDKGGLGVLGLSSLDIVNGSAPGWVTSLLVVVLSLLVLEQSVYRYKKKHLPGAKWTIPVIGKFAGGCRLVEARHNASWVAPSERTLADADVVL